MKPISDTDTVRLFIAFTWKWNKIQNNVCVLEYYDWLVEKAKENILRTRMCRVLNNTEFYSKQIAFSFSWKKFRALNIRNIKIILTSLRNNHFGLQFGLLKRASKTTFLSLPSLANWSISGLKNDSCF